MEEAHMKRAYRRAWGLALLGMIWICLHFAISFFSNNPEPKVSWNMGGVPFVPASSIEADGWPVNPEPTWPQKEKSN